MTFGIIIADKGAKGALLFLSSALSSGISFMSVTPSLWGEGNRNSIVQDELDQPKTGVVDDSGRIFEFWDL